MYRYMNSKKHMLTCQHIACRIVDSCVRNYIPACQVLYLDRRFLYRNGNITFCPSPCMTSEELPLLRVWVHGRRDEEKQVEGMHQGNPLPNICTTSTRGSPAALHMIPDISRPHSPRLRRVNAGICTFSAFARKHCAARVCGTSHPRSHPRRSRSRSRSRNRRRHHARC